MVFDYIDGGAEREWTLSENCRAFEDVLFRPRSAVATPQLRSQHDGARHCRSMCRSSSRPSAAAACSIRAAKSEAAARRRRCRHHLHAVDAVRLHDGRRQGGDDRRRVVSAVSRRRPRRRDGRDRSRQSRRLQGAGRHDRYAGGRHARARFAQRREGAARAQPLDGSVSWPDARASRLAATSSSATAA